MVPKRQLSGAEGQKKRKMRKDHSKEIHYNIPCVCDDMNFMVDPKMQRK